MSKKYSLFFNATCRGNRKECLFLSKSLLVTQNALVLRSTILVVNALSAPLATQWRSEWRDGISARLMGLPSQAQASWSTEGRRSRGRWLLLWLKPELSQASWNVPRCKMGFREGSSDRSETPWSFMELQVSIFVHTPTWGTEGMGHICSQGPVPGEPDLTQTGYSYWQL